MRAEIVAVGTELLLGDIANTNAQTIAAALARIGADCMRHTAVGDNEERIAGAIEAALHAADVAIVTGGLGPTQDDVTREAIAGLTGRPLRRDPALVAKLHETFRRLGRPMPEANLRQADMPEGAAVIENPLGTAPGLLVEHGGGAIFALPGVPREMQRMLEDHVLPELVRRGGAGACIVSRVVRTAAMTESAVAEALSPVWDSIRGATLAFLAGGGEVRVRITAKAADADSARRVLDDAEREVRGALGNAVFGVDDESLAAVVGRLLLDRGWSVGVAESLTGGLVGGRLTEVPGASSYLRGVIVAYATGLKSSLLGVDPALLERHGPVSAETAGAMAAGARTALAADVGVSTTGVAGPAEHGAPVGSVFLAVDGPLGTRAREARLRGGREGVRRAAVTGALDLLRLYLLEAGAG